MGILVYKHSGGVERKKKKKERSCFVLIAFASLFFEGVGGG